MGTNPNWPDRNGSAGGGATSNQRGGAWTNIGMNSPVGSSTKFARTLGQAQGRR